MSQIPWEKHILVGSQCFFFEWSRAPALFHDPTCHLHSCLHHLPYSSHASVHFTHVYTTSLTAAMQVFITFFRLPKFWCQSQQINTSFSFWCFSPYCLSFVMALWSESRMHSIPALSHPDAMKHSMIMYSQSVSFLLHSFNSCLCVCACVCMTILMKVYFAKPDIWYFHVSL